MEHPSLRHRGFNHLPSEIQLNILKRIDSSWLFIQKVRSALPELKTILPVPPPNQYRDTTIPFFNINGEVLAEAVIRTYSVFNFRDGGWIVQVKYNLQDVGRFVTLMHPLTNLRFEHEFVPPRIFDSVRYNAIELRSSYRLTASVNAEVFRKLAVRPESIWSASGDSMILMIWRQGRLALYKSMDNSWGIIAHICVDVICFDRRFYALENTGRTFMVHADRTTTEVVGPIVGVNGHKKCLVESGGSLLLVDQFYHNPDVEDVDYRRTSRFVVFRFEEEEHTWVRIHTLGERVLFVGYFNCFSTAAGDVAGARGDLIYFSEPFAVDDGGWGGDNNENEEGDALHRAEREDVAFFDMVNGIITELRSPGAASFAACFWSPPAWTANAAV